ncbi:hypothetical protein BV898_15828 [Hypsibius exemplaris]|uniref:Receptor ligand binding region domain-containing protein n=1 Tax=Hypsibius exemplaris TaxID=2072580 RepID=A0A9X6NC38_HYPEX|nr:hypothetical protein BV898_15828 [Hypsibius exemplaris]
MTFIHSNAISLGVFLTCLFTVFLSSGSSVEAVNFLSIHLGNVQSSGYVVMQPLFNYSLEAQARQYPRLFQNYTYEAKVRRESPHCGPPGVEASLGLMADIIGEKKSFPEAAALTVLFVPQLDMLAVSCTAVDGSVRKKDRFPSSISLATADSEPYGAALLALMRYYGWRSIAIISDQLGGSTRANRNVEQCRAPLEQLYERRSEFEFHNIITDSYKESFTRALIEATNFSRIILSCTLGEAQRRAMADAFDLKMMTGDYIIIHLFENETPGEPPLSWQRNDDLDVKVRSAFQHLLVLGSPPINWDEFEETSRLMHQRRDSMFGPTTTPDERNEFEVTCYEAVVTVLKVLNESYDPNDARSFSGRFMARKMANRTYDFPLRSITLTDAGTRTIVAVVQHYNVTSDTFQVLFTYNTDDPVLRNSSTSQGRWAQAAIIPDRPRCGLSNQYCTQSATWLTILIAVLAVLVCLLLAGVAGTLWWYLRMQRRSSLRWWCIDNNDFECLYQTANSRLSEANDLPRLRFVTLH